MHWDSLLKNTAGHSWIQLDFFPISLFFFTPLTTVLIQWTAFNLGRLWTTGSLWRGWQRQIFSIQFMRCIALLNHRRRAVSCSFMSVQCYFKAPRVHTFHSKGRCSTKAPISENKTQRNKYLARTGAQKRDKNHMMDPIYLFILETKWMLHSVMNRFFFLSKASCYVIN